MSVDACALIREHNRRVERDKYAAAQMAEKCKFAAKRAKRGLSHLFENGPASATEHGYDVGEITEQPAGLIASPTKPKCATKKSSDLKEDLRIIDLITQTPARVFHFDAIDVQVAKVYALDVAASDAPPTPETVYGGASGSEDERKPRKRAKTGPVPGGRQAARVLHRVYECAAALAAKNGSAHSIAFHNSEEYVRDRSDRGMGIVCYNDAGKRLLVEALRAVKGEWESKIPAG